MIALERSIAQLLASQDGTAPADLAEQILDTVRPDLNTVQELDALPDNAVVVDGRGIVHQKLKRATRSIWSSVQIQEDSTPGTLLDSGPVTVVWSPADEAED